MSHLDDYNNYLIGPRPTDPSLSEAEKAEVERFITKDSGRREQFETGAVRDTQADKPRYDLIPPGPLKRVAELYARGAVKYDDHNWTKGIPTSRFMASLMRHLEQYRAGDRTEDHAAAIVFNAFGLMYFEGTELDDQHDWSQR